MKNVIVTGANGFIGSSLIQRLVEHDIRVIAFDISFANSRLPQSELITKVESKLDDAETIVECVPAGEYDAFYHFAWAGVNGPAKADPVVQMKNGEMTLRCAAAAAQLGVKKFLCAGTIAERATESLHRLNVTSGGMMYGVAKHATRLMLETYCKNVGLPLVWMQFSNIYGPKNRTGNLVSYTLGELTQGKAASFGPALQPYDFIFVDDLIEAIFRLGNCPTSSNAYFLGSGEPRILKDYLLEIGEIVGMPELVQIGKRPDDGIVYTMDMFDTALLKREIGNYVSKSFTEGIKETVKAYKDNG